MTRKITSAQGIRLGDIQPISSSIMGDDLRADCHFQRAQGHIPTRGWAAKLLLDSVPDGGLFFTSGNKKVLSDFVQLSIWLKMRVEPALNRKYPGHRIASSVSRVGWMQVGRCEVQTISVMHVLPLKKHENNCLRNI